MFGSMCECARDAHTTHKHTHAESNRREENLHQIVCVLGERKWLCGLNFILHNATLIKIAAILALTPFLRFWLPPRLLL